MDEAERERLLDRVDRSTATIGAQIPDAVSIGDAEIDLAELIVETRRVDGIPTEYEEEVDAARRALREERTQKAERLASAELTTEEGEALADAIVGIDRALNALENLRAPSYADQHQRTTIEDQKRWVNYLQEVADL